MSFEVSRHIDVPVQVNGNDLLQSLLGFVGPNAAEVVAAALQGDGGYARGYDRFNKTQFQVNTVKNFSNVLGAENFLIVARSRLPGNDVPDYLDGARALRPRVHVRRRLETASLAGSRVAVNRWQYLLADAGRCCRCRSRARCSTRSRTAARTTAI